MKTNILTSKLNFDQTWARSTFERELLNCNKVAVLPFSYWDSEVYDLDSWNSVYSPGKKYYEEIFLPFSTYGIKREQMIYVNYFLDSTDVIEKKIVSSDVLFLTGGAPDLSMKRIVAKNIMGILRRFNGVTIGCSAGAMIQFSKFHITPGPLYPDFMIIEGTSMIDLDIGIEVHYSATEAQLESIDKVSTVYSSLLLLDNESGAVIKNNRIKLLGNAKII